MSRVSRHSATLGRWLDQPPNTHTETPARHRSTHQPCKGVSRDDLASAGWMECRALVPKMVQILPCDLWNSIISRRGKLQQISEWRTKMPSGEPRKISSRK